MIDWQRMWNEDESIRRFSPTRAILYLLSLSYRVIISIRNYLYDRGISRTVRLSCPVISVGNITVGGTGKTPCVIALAKMLRTQGYRPGVISRGYGGKSGDAVNVVSDGKDILLTASEAGDEPLLIANALPGVPVITGPKRILTGQAAIDRFGCNILICDDAFQHRQIHRDINIVLLDASRPLGNGYLLPRGELREPAPNLLRASCFILTRSPSGKDVHPEIDRMSLDCRIPIFRATHRFMDIAGTGNECLQPQALSGKKVCAFCGIAKPESFKQLLLDAGAEVISFIDFPDHYAYNRQDLNALEKFWSAQNADYRITTEKDAMRLLPYPDFLKKLFVARITMDIQPAVPSFEEFIAGKLVKGG